MLRNKGLKWLFYGLCIWFLLIPAKIVYGEEADESQTEDTGISEVSSKAGFSVEVIPAETQIPSEFGFFYVRVKPLEEQTLEVKITGQNEEPVTVGIALVNATTNSYGKIEYSQENAEFDESLKLPLTKFSAINLPKVTVKKAEEKILEIKLSPPETEFQGVRLGALIFTTESEGSESGGITNSYGYKIGLMVSEDLTPYNVGGTLKFKKVKARLNNGQKVVAATLQNPEPYVLENVTMETKLTKKGSTEVLASNGLAGMKIAPNSSFDFLTYLGLEDLSAGKYTLEMTGTDGKEQWHWTEDFNVNQNDADQLNQETVYKLVMPTKYKLVLGSLALLSALNIGYLIYRGGGKFEKNKKSRGNSADRSS